MSKDSANDICLKKDGTLCVIYVVPEAAKSDQAVLDALAQVKENFTSKIERGITFSFIRLDASAEPDFAGMFKLGDELPKVIVMNPGKRKRFLISNGDLTTAGISETLDVILGGDARFKVIKGNKLPDLVNTHDQYLHAEPNVSPLLSFTEAIKLNANALGVSHLATHCCVLLTIKELINYNLFYVQK